jgi:formylglycine-generating enzyme required for sulfatase activity
VGRFQVRARLGAGAFGAVYRAYDPQLEREVALKVPLPGSLGGPTAAGRFLSEAKAAARLHHAHIVPVHEAGFDGTHHYIATAFIEGCTLARAIEERRLDYRQAAKVVRDLAEALDYAHKAGVVHRDVKPANVMLDERGEAYLTDFGLAHRQDARTRLTQLGSVLGTPEYMAPEQAAGQSGPPLPASDQYSLGVILYQLLCGQTPFSGPPQVVLFNVQHRDPPPPRAVAPGAPPRLEAICLKAMARKVERRYASMGEFAAALAEYLRREGPPARIPSAGASIGKPRTARSAVPRPKGGSQPLQHKVEAPAQERAGPVDPADAPRARTTRKKPKKGLLPSVLGGVGLLAVALVVGFGFHETAADKDEQQPKDMAKEKDKPDKTKDTPQGTLVIEVNEPGAEVYVDGERVAVAWAAGGTRAEIRVKPGTHQVNVKKDGFSVDGKELTFKDGDRVVFTARLLPEHRREKTDVPPEKSPPPPGPRPRPLDCTGADGLTAAEVRQAQQAWAKYLGRQVEETVEVAEGVKMTFVLVPPGKFLMGSPKDEEERTEDEALHTVTLTEPFELSKYEVTQAQYEALAGENPSRFKGPDLPVERVSWVEARDYAARLTKKLGDRHAYRLPTEAEWEYSCRGGRSSSKPFGVGDGVGLSSKEANFNGDNPYGGAEKGPYLTFTSRVGSYRANALGLYDMHGNVWEWCADWYGPYPEGTVTNPTGPAGGSAWVCRGGGWPANAGGCRAASRNWDGPSIRPSFRFHDLGFRLARSLPSGSK